MSKSKPRSRQKTANVRVRRPAEFRAEVEHAEIREKLGDGKIEWEVIEDGDDAILRGTLIDD